MLLDTRPQWRTEANGAKHSPSPAGDAASAIKHW